MRRAYIESHVPIDQAIKLALKWAGSGASLHVPNTSIVDDRDSSLERYGLPITCVSSKSRFYAQPRGTVIGVCLNAGEVLETERFPNVDGIVAIQAHGPVRYAESVLSHAPWVTAYDVQHLGGEEIPRTPEAPAPIKTAVKGLTGIAVSNQGLIDKRERSEVIHALTHLRDAGIAIDPDAVMVEALRNDWGKSGPEEIREIAAAVKSGKRLVYDKHRLRPEILRTWAAVTDSEP